MSLTIAPDDLVPGAEIDLGPAAQNVMEILGYDVTRDVAVTALAALLFFLGVAIACLARLNGETHWSRAALVSVPMFLLASPAWTYTLSGAWGRAEMPLLDQIFAAASEGGGPLPLRLFALGIVILMGVLAWPLFNLVREAALRLVTRRLPNAPA